MCFDIVELGLHPALSRTFMEGKHSDTFGSLLLTFYAGLWVSLLLLEKTLNLFKSSSCLVRSIDLFYIFSGILILPHLRVIGSLDTSAFNHHGFVLVDPTQQKNVPLVPQCFMHHLEIPMPAWNTFHIPLYPYVFGSIWINHAKSVWIWILHGCFIDFL